MTPDPIRGHRLLWTFDDGQMKGKTFEHAFGTDGTVRFRSTTDSKLAGSAKYELARINDAVYAVAYQVPGGYTLTTILDTRANTLVSFSSKDGELAQQHGTFELAKQAA